MFLTGVAHSDGLAGQTVDDCRQVHVIRKHHGHICLQHVAQRLGGGKQNLPRAGVIVVFIQLTENVKERQQREQKRFSLHMAGICFSLTSKILKQFIRTRER